MSRTVSRTIIHSGMTEHSAIDRIQLIRLIEQACVSLGYNDVRQQLEVSSGVSLYGSPLIEDLTNACIDGVWEKANALLDKLQVADIGLDLAMRLAFLSEARWLVASQKYLELVEKGDASSALVCLRKELAPLISGQGQQHANSANLHTLAALIMFPRHSSQSGQSEKVLSRRSWVVTHIHRLLPTSLTLPPNRLEGLLHQAIEAQRSKAPFNNMLDTQVSLLNNEDPSSRKPVATTTQTLTDHTDEVWFVAFSHSGTCLASASKDKTAMIWLVKSGDQGIFQVSLVHTLADHAEAVDLVSWSPDDKLILTVAGPVIRLWDVASGVLLHVFANHKEAVSGVAWSQDSSTFFSCGGKVVLNTDLNGTEIIKHIKRATRCQDIALTPDEKFLVLAGSDRYISVLCLADMSEVSFQESSAITSLTLTSIPKLKEPSESSVGYDPLSLLTHPSDEQNQSDVFLLVSLQGHEAHLFSLSTIINEWRKSNGTVPLDHSPISIYSVNDHKPGRWVLRSSFGGGKGAPFIVLGGEDCKGHVFFRREGSYDSQPFLLLEGHTSTVNSVSWSPSDPRFIASASDDKTIRIWSISEN